MSTIFLGGTEKKSTLWQRSDKDLESACRSCKNEDTQRLGEFEDFHHRLATRLGHLDFRAYHCQCCGANWWHLTQLP